MGEDRTPPKRRTTVAEAAEILGISAEAVRGRIRRGTLRVEREEGTVYVLLEGTVRDSSDDDQSRTTAERTRDRTDLLIAELQDRVRSLEEANRENRQIIAALTSRMPAIEAPQEAADDAETVEEASEGKGSHPAAEEDQEEFVAERARREMAEATLHEGMAEERRRREEAERERDGLRLKVHGLMMQRGYETVEEEPDRAEPRSAAGGPWEGARRPWWRFWR